MAGGQGVRRFASLLFALGVVLLLFSAYIALVYHGDIDAGASWIVGLAFETWILVFFITLVLIAFVLVVLLAVAPREREEGPAHPEIEITCANCARPYLVTDTGDRPLYHACPYCGHSDAYEEEQIPEVEAEPEPVAEPEQDLVPGTIRETPAGEKELILRCSNCRHVFPTPYTEERPLYAYCPNCGKKGVLTEPAPGTDGEPMDALDEDHESNVPSVDEDEWDERRPTGA